MNEQALSDSADASWHDAHDAGHLIVALRGAGAQRFDPVRWHYIESLAQRAAAHRGNVARLLDARLKQALAAFKERFEQAQSDARETVAGSAQQYPQAADNLQQLLADGDFRGLQRFAAALKGDEQRAALRALLRRLEQHVAGSADACPDVDTGPRIELKTLRNSRGTWSKLSVDKQVAKALEQAPKNAGPINSHMLVLRSLALMREISPDYLNRFISYADTLLCLDQCEKEKAVNPKKQQAARMAKK